MTIAVALALSAVLLAIGLAGMRYPLAALRVLLVLLPLHSAGFLLLRNVLGVDPLVLTLFGAWKEVVLLGIGVAAVTRLRRTGPAFTVVHWLALTLLAAIFIRAGFDLLASDQPILVLYAARQLAEFALVFVVVALLRPSREWFLRTAMLLIPVVGAAAVFAIAQPGLGVDFYDEYFHAAGERLHHAYLVNIGEVRRLRAVGTFIAPNEFGLGMLIYGAVFIAPLLVMVRRWWLVLLILLLVVMALLLTFSRSAWLGTGVGTVVAALLAGRHLLRLRAQRKILNLPLQQLVVGTVSAVGSSAAVFVLIGGITLLLSTVTGSESSAAGRGESIGRGVEATLDNLGGLGLGTAGPLALERAGSAVLTENWFLVYGIQLGVIPMGILAAVCAAALVSVARRTRAMLLAAQATAADSLDVYASLVGVGVFCALVGAMVGALVIPALLDLPAAITLWASVAIVLGWRTVDPTSTRSVGPP
jgi:hypothetical protein